MNLGEAQALVAEATGFTPSSWAYSYDGTFIVPVTDRPYVDTAIAQVFPDGTIEWTPLFFLDQYHLIRVDDPLAQMGADDAHGL